MIAIVIIIVSSILIVGFINKFRAWMAGRSGVRFFQPLYTVGTLMRKASVYSNSSTFITKLAPLVYLGAIIVAMMLLPLGGSYGAVVEFEGDLIVFCMLLALSRMMLLWAALDSGSSFQGMGASREALFSILAEPAFFILLATLAMISGHYSFTSIFANFDNMSLVFMVLSLVIGYGVLKLSFVECGRVPIDDTRTHLELTMIHEVMVLDFSGIDLAYIHIGGWFKLSIFALLIVNLFVPSTVEGWLLLTFYSAGVLLYSFIIALVESFSARNRMNKNATYIVAILAVGLLAYIVVLMLHSSML